MNSATLLQFLIGQAEAIRSIAACGDAAIVGAVLVLSAGLARTWQRQDLVARPWLLVVPYAASVVSASVFVLLLNGLASVQAGRLQGVVSGLFTVLALFWMTAPLAWLYGLPFERWSANRGIAVKRRLWALAVVSVWRMALMARVLCVLGGLTAWSAVLFVVVFGDIVAITAVWLIPKPKPERMPQVMSVMGGFSPRGSHERRVVQRVSGCLLPFMWLTLIIGLPLLFENVSKAPPIRLPAPPEPRSTAASDLWSAAFGSVAFWTLLLPLSQRKQRVRTKLELLIEHGEYQQAVAELARRSAPELPVKWVPPVQDVLEGAGQERFFGLMEAAAALPADSWARSTLSDILFEYVRDPLLYWYDDDRVGRTAGLLDEFPGLSSADAAEILRRMDFMKKMSDPWPEMTADRQTLRNCLMAIAGHAYQRRSNAEEADGGV